jgi:poly(3-hydroxyalkanoate) synthetase
MGQILSGAINYSVNVSRYSLAWMAACEQYNSRFMSDYMTAARTALSGYRNAPLSPKSMIELTELKIKLAYHAIRGTLESTAKFHAEQSADAYSAMINTLFRLDGETLVEFTDREAKVMEGVAFDFPRAMDHIKEEFGFQFESEGYELAEETDCFKMYQVFPTKEGVKVDPKGKPVLLIPPYMLGVHILAFLPGEGKSYAHAFANQGVPTYVRVVKPIDETPAVQTMTCEDDSDQTLELCRLLKRRHGQSVTLNGICQGGYVALMNILSGKYKSVVDALITTVTPLDGTRSKRLGGFIQGLPGDLSTHFAYDTLPNRNLVVNGDVMSLGVKLLALKKEAPMVTMYNMKALHKQTGGDPGKTAAAINRWLHDERVHLPIAIAEMSSKTFRDPIGEDGTLPVKLYDKTLNLHDLKKLGISWLIAHSRGDDLVEKDSALGGVDTIKKDGVVTVSEFPGGHVGILTSFAGENSKCPLAGEFNGMVGPVKYHLDLARKKRPARKRSPQQRSTPKRSPRQRPESKA